MTPIAIIQELVKVDKPVATLILAGLSLFAAVAIFQTFKLDLEGSVLVAAYIAAFGVAMLILSRFSTDAFSMLLINRCLAVIACLYMAVLFISAVSPPNPYLKPPSCLLRFWASCEGFGGVIDRIAERAATPDVTAPPRVGAASPQTPPAATGSPPATPPPTASGGTGTAAAPATTSRFATYQVFLQFAGLLKREDMITVARGLRDIGWRAEGVDRGGERTPNAAGFNEVRYASPADKEAAETLAQQLQATNIVGGNRIVAVQNPRIKPNTLEVWISRT